jgi:aspartate-semialdehyde dehydrogenase
VYLDSPDRLQRRLDVEHGGMIVQIGRLRHCHVLDYIFIMLEHNTIRGAAGSAILDAELLAAKQFLG